MSQFSDFCGTLFENIVIINEKLHISKQLELLYMEEGDDEEEQFIYYKDSPVIKLNNIENPLPTDKMDANFVMVTTMIDNTNGPELSSDIFTYSQGKEILMAVIAGSMMSIMDKIFSNKKMEFKEQ